MHWLRAESERMILFLHILNDAKKTAMKKFIPFIIGSILVGADWLLKFVALSKTSESEVFLFPGIGFTLVKNPGIAFGILFNNIFVIIAIIVLLSGVLWFAVHAHQKRLNNRASALFLIFMGGASNAADRIFHGFIVDYIHIFFWPVFNLADALVVFSVAYLVYLELAGKERF